MTRIYNVNTKPAANVGDLELWVGVQANPALGIANIYDQYAHLVFGLARTILADSQEAEDLCHEVFVGLMHKGGYDPERGSLAGFLCTMTRSRAIDLIRRRGRTRKAHSTYAQDVSEDTAPTASDHFTMSESVAGVRTALAMLPATQRKALELAYFEGLSQSQISERLSAPLGTVKTWIRGGLLGLRASLSDAE